MNRQTNDGENRETRTPENWLASLARIYGPWHLGLTSIQTAAWTAFVYWNESGKQDAWADVVQTAVEKMLIGVPGASILSIIFLATIEKVGKVAFKFIDERRKRIATAWSEGHSEGRAEGLGEAYVSWTEWNRRREEAEKRGERFDEPPPSLNGR